MDLLVEQLETKTAARKLEYQKLVDEVKLWMEENKKAWIDEITAAFYDLDNWKDGHKYKLRSIKFHYNIKISIPKNYWPVINKNDILNLLEQNFHVQLTCKLSNVMDLIKLRYFADINSEIVRDLFLRATDNAISTISNAENWKNSPEISELSTYCECVLKHSDKYIGNIWQNKIEKRLEILLKDSRFSTTTYKFNGSKSIWRIVFSNE